MPEHKQGGLFWISLTAYFRRQTYSTPDTKIDHTNNPIRGKSVAIVDDAVTSGATARSLASILIKAGAKHVDIWCIARTGWHIMSD